MRNSIIAIGAALALASTSALATGNGRIITHNTNSYGGGLVTGTTASAGSVSGAVTTGNGYAATAGRSDMTAHSAGRLVVGPSYALVGGRTSVSGNTVSETLVLGQGAAGTIAGGNAGALTAGTAGFESGSHQHYCGRYFCSPGFNYQTNEAGDAGILAKSKGGAVSATGSIGTGYGLSANGFSATGNAKAMADVDRYRGGLVTTDSGVWTGSSGEAYSLNLGNAVGGAGAIGVGIGHADAWAVAPR